jgi:hypothetical protein
MRMLGAFPSGIIRACQKTTKYVPLTTVEEPSVVWAVEYTDERQPGCQFQLGAFTTEAGAHKLLRQLDSTGSYGELSINLILDSCPPDSSGLGMGSLSSKPA